jgi:hypothetical protein
MRGSISIGITCNRVSWPFGKVLTKLRKEFTAQMPEEQKDFGNVPF